MAELLPNRPAGGRGSNPVFNMKSQLKLLFAIILAVSALIPVTNSYAGRIVVEIGDRGYYNRGPFYFERGRRWVWVPGHWNRRHTRWIHGHYRPV